MFTFHIILHVATYNVPCFQHVALGSCQCYMPWEQGYCINHKPYVNLLTSLLQRKDTKQCFLLSPKMLPLGGYPDTAAIYFRLSGPGVNVPESSSEEGLEHDEYMEAQK